MNSVRAMLAMLLENLFIRHAMLLQAHLQVTVSIRLACSVSPSAMQFTDAPSAHLALPNSCVPLSPLQLLLFITLTLLNTAEARPTLSVLVKVPITLSHLAPVVPSGIAVLLLPYSTAPKTIDGLFKLANVMTPWEPLAALSAPAI